MMLEIILWSFVLIIFAIGFILMFIAYRRQNNKYYLGVMIFFLLFFIARICVFLNFYLFGYQGDIIYLIGYPVWFWLQLGYVVFSHGGLFFIYYALESEILNKESQIINTRFIFSILTIVDIIISIVNFVIITELTFLIAPILLTILLCLPLLYLYIGIKSSDQARINAFFFSLGILLVEFGILLALPEARLYVWAYLTPAWVPIFFAPIFHILGGVILLWGIRGLLRSMPERKS